MNVTIYHNPDCGTSCNVLGLIRNSGEDPVVIEYLKTPPSHDTLKDLIARMGISVRICCAGKARLMTRLASAILPSAMISCLAP